MYVPRSDALPCQNVYSSAIAAISFLAPMTGRAVQTLHSLISFSQLLVCFLQPILISVQPPHLEWTSPTFSYAVLFCNYKLTSKKPTLTPISSPHLATQIGV